MNKPKNMSIRLQSIFRSVVISSALVIVIVPLDISGWLTALLRYAF